MNRDKEQTAKSYPSYHDDEEATQLCDRLRSEIEKKTKRIKAKLGKKSIIKKPKCSNAQNADKYYTFFF